MFQLTVGYVAGIIAAAIFIARMWAPNVVTFIISGLLQDKSSAATWTVAARAFQRSYWPDILRADSTHYHGVRKDILVLAKLSTFMGLLIAVAGVVTPLGLYQALVPADSVQTPFQYLKDTSPFGLGTPPRSNLSFNRKCGWWGPRPCPFSDTIAIYSTDGDWQNYSYPYGYDMSIPQAIRTVYSSGVDNNTTISNYFDIQWRRYLTTSDDTFNNGSTYLVNSFRNMDSLILNNATEAVEGLIVDTKKGGIGFRNHTVPPSFPHGTTWDEDILFIEPESQCVDTNLTIDFSVSLSPNYSALFTDVVLTDRGGFININHTYPEPNLTNPQVNQDLWGRAYKAAWLNNVYTALYYNVTSDRNESLGTHAFDYLNSAVGQTYPLSQSQSGLDSISYDSLIITPTFGDYLQLNGVGAGSVANTSDPASSGGASNPYNIDTTNFTSITILCTGAGNGDYANITNVYASCGLMHGIPQRQDDGDKLTFDSGSKWSQKIYSCATTVRATIKVVSFSYNGTDYNLKNLIVTNIEDKVYPDEKSMPLWGVENTGNAYMENEISLIWGLVSSAYENNPNVSAIRQPSLYLPGYDAGILADAISSLGSQNLPGSDFYSGAMFTAYGVGQSGPSSFSAPQVDYSGGTNMAMWTRWQNLTMTPETAGLIPNLIWTDNAAAAVVGTKGILGPGNTAQHNLVPLQVTPTISRIKYHWPFAIPALLVALLLVIITLLALVTVCLRGTGIDKLKLHLRQTSPGRIFTTFLYPVNGGYGIRSKDWSRQLGKKVIDLSGAYPLAAEATEMMPPEKGLRVAEYQSSTSGDISAAEGERLVRNPSPARETLQGGFGGYGFAPAPEYQRTQHLGEGIQQ